jgi:hypothetical protein
VVSVEKVNRAVEAFRTFSISMISSSVKAMQKTATIEFDMNVMTVSREKEILVVNISHPRLPLAPIKSYFSLLNKPRI